MFVPKRTIVAGLLGAGVLSLAGASTSSAAPTDGGPVAMVLGKAAEFVLGIVTDKLKEELKASAVLSSETKVSFQPGGDLHVSVGDLYQINLDTHFQHNAHQGYLGFHGGFAVCTDDFVGRGYKAGCVYHYVVIASMDGKEVVEKELASFKDTAGDKTLDAKPSLYLTATGLQPTHANCTTEEEHTLTVKALVRLTYSRGFHGSASGPVDKTETVVESSASTKVFIGDPWEVALDRKPATVYHAGGAQTGTLELQLIRKPHKTDSPSIGTTRWVSLNESFAVTKSGTADAFAVATTELKERPVVAEVIKTVDVPWEFQAAAAQQAADGQFAVKQDGRATGMTDAGPGNTQPQPWSAPLETGPNVCQPVTWAVADKAGAAPKTATGATGATGAAGAGESITTKVGPPTISGGGGGR